MFNLVETEDKITLYDSEGQVLNFTEFYGYANSTVYYQVNYRSPNTFFCDMSNSTFTLELLSTACPLNDLILMLSVSKLEIDIQETIM